MDQLPRLGKRELICLLLFTCHCVVSVRRGFLLLFVLGMGYVILLWHSLSLPYNYYAPNFEKVDGAYCFWSVGAWVRACVRAWVTLFVPTVLFKPLKLES